MSICGIRNQIQSNSSGKLIVSAVSFIKNILKNDSLDEFFMKYKRKIKEFF
jgi:hypothetical protein